MKNQTANKAKHLKENYERVSLAVKKGQKEIIKKQADYHNLSIMSYIQWLIKKDLEETSPPTD